MEEDKGAPCTSSLELGEGTPGAEAKIFVETFPKKLNPELGKSGQLLGRLPKVKKQTIRTLEKSTKEVKKREDIRKFFDKEEIRTKEDFKELPPTPSSGEIEQQVRKESPKEPLDNTEQCNNFKKGVCQVHQIMGVKTVISAKKWGKKKDGLLGWIYQKKVRWTCKWEKVTAPDSTSNSETSIPASIAAPISSNLGPRTINLGISLNNGVRESDLVESESCWKDQNSGLEISNDSVS